MTLMLYEVYLPFVAPTLPSSTSAAGVEVSFGAPELPPCSRNAFSCSAVWTQFMLNNTNNIPITIFKKKKKGTTHLQRQ